MAQLVGASSYTPKKVKGSFPAKGAYLGSRFRVCTGGSGSDWCVFCIDVCLSTPSYLSKINKHFLEWGLKKDIVEKTLTVLYIFLSNYCSWHSTVLFAWDENIWIIIRLGGSSWKVLLYNITFYCYFFPLCGRMEHNDLSSIYSG